jgi:hypothetical protein
MRPTPILALALAAGMAAAQPADKPGTSLTIYSSAAPGAIDPSLYRPNPNMQPWQYQQLPPVPGYALVRQHRMLDIAAARSEVRYTDVASLIDPTTVQFTSLSDPGTTVLEQNYQFDLVSGEKLLQKFIDQEVRVTVQRGDKAEFVDGTLLSSSGGQLIIRTKGGIQMLNGYLDVQALALPKGLMTRPTLVWSLATDKPGAHLARVSYQTEGATWWADYNLTFTEGSNANSGTLGVAAWVSIINQTGATYEDATLKLIAGDVHRAPRPQSAVPSTSPYRDALDMNSAREEGFQEKSFFEYHLYTLGRPTTLPNNSTKQIELFPAAAGVPCEKVIVYDGLGTDFWWGDGLYTDQGFGAQSRKDVDVYLRFKNSRENRLGMPLPAGRIRVNKVDAADGSMEFIGEDVIRHTPRDEEVMVKMGRAFDIVGERVQTDFRIDLSRETIDETFEIKVRNRKEEAVTVVVQEHMFRWATWELLPGSTQGKKVSSRLMHFPLTLKAGEEGVVRYTVRYTW